MLAALQQDVQEVCGRDFGVKACSDGEQALALIDGFRAPDMRVPLIITEQRLPGISGIDLLLALHEKPDYRATGKILASQSATVLDLSLALNRGALHRLIGKPWSGEELSECVQSALTSFFVHHADPINGQTKYANRAARG